MPRSSLVFALPLSLALIGAASAGSIDPGPGSPSSPDLAVDFRTWSDAGGQQSHEIDNIIGTTGAVRSVLYQDSELGLGVNGTIHGGMDPVQIDHDEMLKVKFRRKGRHLGGIWITNLQGEAGDRGHVVINGSHVIHFDGSQADHEGHLFIEFDGQIRVKSAAFFADEAPVFDAVISPYAQDIQGVIRGPSGGYNVGGFTSVPEPATLALLGAGAAGSALVARRRRRRAA